MRFALLAFSGLLFACGGSIADGIDSGTTNDSGTSDAKVDGPTLDGGGPCPNTAVGQSIYGSCFDAITVNKYDSGFAPPPPQGSECPIVGDTYDYDLKSGKLDLTNCSSPGLQQPLKKTKTTRILMPGAQTGVITALGAVVVVADPPCVSDGPTLNLIVHAKGKDTTFGDAKISGCAGVPVNGIDGVIGALLAK